MGWKSTISITREQATEAILIAQNKKREDPFAGYSNRELEEMLYELEVGDDRNLPYFGHNFIVHDNQDEIDKIEQEEQDEIDNIKNRKI